MNKKFLSLLSFLSAAIVVLSACSPFKPSQLAIGLELRTPPAGPAADSVSISPTPLPTRPPYKPGELVDYTAQSGDTIPALASHFNTTVAEIMAANPIIPANATTMPPGLPMKIPVYYQALWASPFKIIPDGAFVNGPMQVGFNTSAFVAAHPNGWLNNYRAYAGSENRTGAQIVEYVATKFSVSPRLLLAILEYQTGALSEPEIPKRLYLLGNAGPFERGLYLQLLWAANTLNNGYYGWRIGNLTSFDLPDGTLIRPDPWQNAASVGVQYYFSRILSGTEYERAVGSDGLAQTYTDLFGDAWQNPAVLIPGNLQQPPLLLPFGAGHVWTYTGAPHPALGEGEPLSALDFAPPTEFSGCAEAEPQEFSIAMADGLVVRVETGVLILDLDGDGDERTGWTIFYLHISTKMRAPVGQAVKAGDPLGYPSCEGGRSTGTHIQIARRYNGEWIPAYGPLAFNLQGWIAEKGARPYLGTLRRNGQVVQACECSDLYSRIIADPNP
ncbi:MAG: LysM peptidoglycan-binding domain-containing protein [Chloroflexi bacterium]|nr:LysM peptidoglycan-binding domain-containing protein [Chloroflexota bacterium]MBI3341305.1 LysM peptidoglycan-binding domain-containing protein [Chloroflexota bacterium]